MRPPLHLTKGQAAILSALARFVYLTARQVTRLLYAEGSFTYVTTQLKALAESGLAVTIGGRGTSLPRIYTVTGKGRSVASTLSEEHPRRFRPAEAREKQTNTYFMRHLLTVNDVLISATLLSQTRPDVTLTHMYREPELRRRIYVELPERICIEPDGGCQFLSTKMGLDRPETWEDFFFIELYRTLPPVKERFKQKIQGYITYGDTGQHEALFQTPALSIAVIATSDQMATLLKAWTEEALQQIGRAADGDWFFFCSINPATASPEELFLSPLWEQAFGTAKTPLLMLEEETK
jgi:DNA-binding MarR family transcriptional regulator